MVKYQLYLNVNPLNPNELVMVKEEVYRDGRFADGHQDMFIKEAKKYEEKGYKSKVLRVELNCVYKSDFYSQSEK